MENVTSKVEGEKKREKTGGRQKGTPNKMTQAVKDVISEAAAELGGKDRLVAWAQTDPANERAFWTKIYPKLLPLQVSGDPENPLQVVQRVELVALSDDNGAD